MQAAPYKTRQRNELLCNVVAVPKFCKRTSFFVDNELINVDIQNIQK